MSMATTTLMTRIPGLATLLALTLFGCSKHKPVEPPPPAASTASADNVPPELVGTWTSTRDGGMRCIERLVHVGRIRPRDLADRLPGYRRHVVEVFAGSRRRPLAADIVVVPLLQLHRIAVASWCDSCALARHRRGCHTRLLLYPSSPERTAAAAPFSMRQQILAPPALSCLSRNPQRQAKPYRDASPVASRQPAVACSLCADFSSRPESKTCSYSHAKTLDRPDKMENGEQS